MFTDEMVPMPPRRLDRGDLIDLFASAVDRPLFLACREVSCSALYYAHAVLCRIEDEVARLSRWYDGRIYDRLWHPEVAHTFDRAGIALGAARHGAYVAWQRVTGYWRDQREPVRFATVLTEFRYCTRGRFGVAQVA